MSNFKKPSLSPTDGDVKKIGNKLYTIHGAWGKSALVIIPAEQIGVENDNLTVISGDNLQEILETIDTIFTSLSGGLEDSNITVENGGTPVVSGLRILDFGHALTAISGADTESVISLSEDQLQTVVFLYGDQTVSGVKSFNDLLVANSGAEVHNGDLYVQENIITDHQIMASGAYITGDLQCTANVIIDGELFVLGQSTLLWTENLYVEDNIVTLNSTVTGTPLLDSGLDVNRGTEQDAGLHWNENNKHWTAGVSGTLERILLETDLININFDITTLSGLIDTNTTGISNNSSDITTLSGLINTNTTNISVNASGVADNSSDIATVSGLVATNTTNISTNSSDITTLSGLINTNTTNISTNTSDISTISGLVDTNTTNISNNTLNITSLSGYVDNTFVRVAGDTMEGHLSLYDVPTLSGHATNKFYVDNLVGAIASTVSVENDNAEVVAEASTLDFGKGITVTSGTSNEAEISVSGVVLTSENQTIDGIKTFGDKVQIKTHPAYTGSERIVYTDGYQTTGVGIQVAEIIPVSSSSILHFKITVQAYMTAGTGNKSYWATLEGAAVRYGTAGTVLVDTVGKASGSNGTPAWNADVIQNTNNIELRLDGGSSGEIVTWTAIIEYQEAGGVA